MADAPVVNIGVPGMSANGAVSAPGIGTSTTMDQLKTMEGGIATPQVFYNGGWQTSLPTDSPYYVDPWLNLHQGADMGNGYTFFNGIAPERNGTAQLLYDWNGDSQWVQDNVQKDTTFNGQQGFAVKNDAVGGIHSNMAQGGRDNGKYAVKSSGFGLGELLAIGAAIIAPELSGFLATGTFGVAGATLGTDIVAGAIAGGVGAAATGGNIIKGALLGGAGAGLGDAAGIASKGGTIGLNAASPTNLGVAGSIAKGAAGAVPGALASGNVGGIVAGAVSGGVNSTLQGSGVYGPLASVAGAVAGHYAAGVIQPTSITTDPNTGAPVVNAPTTNAPTVAAPVPSITANAPGGVIASNSTVSPWGIKTSG